MRKRIVTLLLALTLALSLAACGSTDQTPSSGEPESSLTSDINSDQEMESTTEPEGSTQEPEVPAEDAEGTDAEKPAEASVNIVEGCEVYVALSGLVDFEAERKRLNKERDQLVKFINGLERKLSNPGYLAKAAPEVQQKDRDNYEADKEKLALIKNR